MLEGIPWQSVGAVLTPVGLYMLGFILMMRGDLIPRKTHAAAINRFAPINI